MQFINRRTLRCVFVLWYYRLISIFAVSWAIMTWNAASLLLLFLLQTASFSQFSETLVDVSQSETLLDKPAVPEMCNATLETLVPEWDNTLYTCENRCGSDLSVPCSCDTLCTLYGDCCDDFKHHCPGVESVRSPLTTSNISANDSNSLNETWNGTTFQSSSLPVSQCTHLFSRLVAICSQSLQYPDPNAATVESKCRLKLPDISNFQDLLPVTDRSTGIHFKNIHCFICNGGKPSNGLVWSVRINPTSATEGFPLTSLQDVLKLAKDNTTNVFAVPPQGIRQRACIPDFVWKTNSVSCLCPNLHPLCDKVDGYISSNTGIFRNRYCLICDLATRGKRLRYATIITPLNIGLIRGPSSFSILMKWNDLEDPSNEIQDLTRSPFVLSGFFEVQSNSFLPWTRMVCQMQGKRKTAEHAIQSASVTSHPRTSAEKEKEQSDDKNQASGVIVGGLGRLLPKLTTNQHAISVNGSQSNETAQTDDTQNKEKRTEGDGDIPGDICQQIECMSPLYPYKGLCRQRVLGSFVAISYARNNECVQYLQQTDTANQSSLHKQLNASLQKSLSSMHPDLAHDVKEVKHDMMNKSMRVITLHIILKNTEQWNDNYLRKELSERGLNLTLRAVFLTLQSLCDADRNSLDICTRMKISYSRSFLGRWEATDDQMCQVSQSNASCHHSTSDSSESESQLLVSLVGSVVPLLWSALAVIEF